jgi:hypothetical protein
VAKKKAKKDGINRRHIEEEYGLSYALFQSAPELKDLLKEAVKNSWTTQRFQVELRNTDWFKKHSDTWREGTALKFSDPTTYRQKVAEQLMTVQALAGKFGARLDGATANRLAERALLLGWSAGDIQNHLANYVVPQAGGHYGGDLSAIEQNLQSTAANNGVRISAGQLKGWMRNIVRGNASTEQYETMVRDIAAKTFSAYGEQIKAGMDLKDLASPYVQSMSQILELNPGSLDLFDPTIRKALSYRNEKGENIPLGISDFENSLRQDKRWQYTKQAKDAAKGLAASIGQMWGVS